MRIATWNTQGHCLSNGKLAHLVNSHSPDVICVQECGDLLNSSCSRLSGPFRSLYISSYNFGTPSRCIKYNIIYYPWRDACRCSMATFVKQGYTISDFSLKPYNTTSDRTATWYDIRDMLQTVVKYNNSVISINNVHLPSGCPKYAKNIALYLRFQCRCHNSNYIMIGDMNVPVEMWQNSFFMYPHIPYCTRRTHQGGKILDYMFTDMTVRRSWITNALYSSDHLCVCYDVEC